MSSTHLPLIRVPSLTPLLKPTRRPTRLPLLPRARPPRTLPRPRLLRIHHPHHRSLPTTDPIRRHLDPRDLQRDYERALERQHRSRGTVEAAEGREGEDEVVFGEAGVGQERVRRGGGGGNGRGG